MCGDWNFTLDSLAVTLKLRAAGWVEVQELHQFQTGAPHQAYMQTGVSQGLSVAFP